MKDRKKLRLVQDIHNAVSPPKEPSPIKQNRKRSLREIFEEVKDKQREMKSLEETLSMKHESLIETKREFNAARRKAFTERLAREGQMFCSYCLKMRSIGICHYVMERSQSEDAVKVACNFCFPQEALLNSTPWLMGNNTKIYLVRRSESKEMMFVDGNQKYPVPNSLVDRRIPSELPQEIAEKLDIPPEMKI